ncbi:MAG: glycosyltransferase involved in cell wall biosynthesis [Roseivirga sp.]
MRKHQLLKNQNFIFVGNQPWDYPIGSNCKNIAEVIAKDNTVLYVNRPLDRITKLKNAAKDRDFITKRVSVLQGKTDPITHIKDGLYTLDPAVLMESINWLPDGLIYDWALKHTSKKLFAEIQKAASKMNFKDYYFFNDSEMFQGLLAPELLNSKLNIYYSRDNLTSTGYFKKHGLRLEPKLLKEYDLALANSLYLKDYCLKHNPKSYYVGQGCDLTIFNPEIKQAEPAEFVNIPHPRIGYIGALLRMRLDLKLLEDLATSRKDWSFVYVGPEDEHFQSSILHQMDNVYFLGPKKPEELGEYLSAFDLAMNPQELNEMTIGNYPRKIDEYLAMGKPTLGTPTRAMEVFKDHVYLADGAKGYEQAIVLALEEDNDEKQAERIRFAQSHSWKNCVDEIYKAIEQSENRGT